MPRGVIESLSGALWLTGHGPAALVPAWNSMIVLPSGSKMDADHPMPGIGSLPWAPLPPHSWTRLRLSPSGSDRPWDPGSHAELGRTCPAVSSGPYKGN